MLNIGRILHQDRLLRATTRLNRRPFESLLEKFEQVYLAEADNREKPRKRGSSVCVMQWTEVIRDETLIEKEIWRFLPIVFALERTNQLSLLPDKDLGRLMPPDQTIPSNEEPF